MTYRKTKKLSIQGAATFNITTLKQLVDRNDWFAITKVFKQKFSLEHKGVREFRNKVLFSRDDAEIAAVILSYFRSLLIMYDVTLGIPESLVCAITMVIVGMRNCLICMPRKKQLQSVKIIVNLGSEVPTDEVIERPAEKSLDPEKRANKASDSEIPQNIIQILLSDRTRLAELRDIYKKMRGTHQGTAVIKCTAAIIDYLYRLSTDDAQVCETIWELFEKDMMALVADPSKLVSGNDALYNLLGNVTTNRFAAERNLNMYIQILVLLGNRETFYSRLYTLSYSMIKSNGLAMYNYCDTAVKIVLLDIYERVIDLRMCDSYIVDIFDVSSLMHTFVNYCQRIFKYAIDDNSHQFQIEVAYIITILGKLSFNLDISAIVQRNFSLVNIAILTLRHFTTHDPCKPKKKSNLPLEDWNLPLSRIDKAGLPAPDYPRPFNLKKSLLNFVDNICNCNNYKNNISKVNLPQLFVEIYKGNLKDIDVKVAAIRAIRNLCSKDSHRIDLLDLFKKGVLTKAMLDELYIDIDNDIVTLKNHRLSFEILTNLNKK